MLLAMIQTRSKRKEKNAALAFTRAVVGPRLVVFVWWRWRAAVERDARGAVQPKIRSMMTTSKSVSNAHDAITASKQYLSRNG